MIKIKLTALFLLVAISSFSQESKDSIKTNQLEEVKLIALRYTRSAKNSQQITTITKKEIENQNAQNTADVLSNSGKVTIQKSQQGGGSPVLRGFESSRILLLVDGVRMNNLIFRSGHLQNIITVDENMIDNIDVLFGPASTIYGSDALGGAINIQTKKPVILSSEYNKKFAGNFNTRYSTVNTEKSGYLDLSFSGTQWASLSSFSYNDFGDLKMGRRKNGKNDFFGERPFYVETINNQDVVVANEDPLLQKFSGYKQYNAMQKILFQPSQNIQHLLNLQYSISTDIPRYDRLTDLKSGALKTATWNYGPQKRFLAGYKYLKENCYQNSDLTIGANYQNVEESRITRDFGKPAVTSRLEKVNVYSVSADLKTKLENGNLLYGVEAFYDDLNSTATATNITTNVSTPAGTRYPNGKNYTLRSDFFTTYFANINNQTSYNLGARIGYIRLHSDIDMNTLNLPYTTVDQKNITYSGVAGIVNNPTRNIKLAFNLASGFRAPNVDDLSKIFESAAGALIVPNADIKPEKTITGDLSVTLSDKDIFEFANTLYYTRLYDAIVTDRFNLNGQNTVIYEGQQSIILANQNLGKGTIIGYSTSIKARLFQPVHFYGTFNFTHGRIESEKGEKPLDHIPPLNGKVGFNFDSKWVKVDLFMLYSGKKDLKDYSDSGEDNLQYAAPGGTPAWQTYNLKTTITAIKYLKLYTGIENLFDIQYRTFASGINAPGKNIYFGAKYEL